MLAGHFIWTALLYILAGIYSGENPLEVVRHYGPAYLTAIGTMSSAATLAVALQCASKAKPLRKDLVSFGIPLFANIHLCGSVLTEVFFCMAISKILYGSVPTPGTMVLFCLLLGIFAIGAPGVPGGTVMASLGIITGILKFDSSGTALMLTIFALQDSFGTACNVTGDGALTLMLTAMQNAIILRSSSLMWNFKFGAKSDGYLRSDPLRCLLITGYQANINQISKMPQAFKMALRHFLLYFYLFLSVSVSFYCFYMLLLFLYVFLFTGGSLFLLL